MSSWTLRLWILLAGLVVIGAIFAWGKLQERRSGRGRRVEPPVGDMGKVARENDDWDVIPVLRERHEAPPRAAPPTLSDDELADVVISHAQPAASTPEPRGAEAAPARPKPAPARPARPEPAPPPPPPKELIITLSVLAPRSREFPGTELAAALRDAGMVYGAMKIWHAPVDLDRPDGPALFSLANVLEPGTLEPERLKLLETPGVVLFAQLPCPVKGVEVFEHMQSTGRFIARQLNGQLCDDQRRVLTSEKAEEIRSRILAEIGDTIRKPDF